MNATFTVFSARLMLLLCLAASWSGLARAAGDEGPALRARYAQLADKLRQNTFQRALYIDSSEGQDRLNGDAYAVLEQPFATVSLALREPAQWCDVLILPFNTKYCHAVDSAAGPQLLVRIGRKFNQPVDEAFRLAFDFRRMAASEDYFETRLAAVSGPLGTRDYRIVLTATPLDARRTFMHLSYSYGYGFAGRVAMQGYLATVGANKVGFTITGRDANGEPVLLGGMRGAVERNAMRYYLAIDAYLDSLAAPPAGQAERRIQAWFSATERYPRQLREMDRTAYVAMKRTENERQHDLIN